MRAAAARPGRATADFSKRTIVAGPHVWRVGGPAIDESSVGIRSPDRALRRNRRWRWLGPMLPPGIRPRRPGPPCMRLRRPILKANRTAPAGQRGCSGASTRPIQQLDSQRMSCGLRAWNQDYAALRLLYQRKAVASDSEWPMRDRKATRRRLPTRTARAGELPVRRLHMVCHSCMMRTNVSTEPPQAAVQPQQAPVLLGARQARLGLRTAATAIGVRKLRSWFVAAMPSTSFYISVKCPRFAG